MTKLVKKRIEELLRTFPQLREDDRKLMIVVWRQDLENAGYFQKSFFEIFFRAFLKKDISHQFILTNPEAVRRSRCKVQAQYPELRTIESEIRANKSEIWEEELGYRPPSTNPIEQSQSVLPIILNP